MQTPFSVELVGGPNDGLVVPLQLPSEQLFICGSDYVAHYLLETDAELDTFQTASYSQEGAARDGGSP